LRTFLPEFMRPPTQSRLCFDQLTLLANPTGFGSEAGLDRGTQTAKEAS
jgi:hypothetical protein